ncbi:AAA family ATPase [Streptomyces apricus]|uniref:Phosphotransferase n=1 Tax=Streptomyces apricus TaxID=1828112 RepID=A0A5B0AKL3_9ACTN|nr:AAA family ATPase [Streptomyces apricus]KAA0930448.1 phosphotransferase [Streptomyces apricus]
MDGVVLITGIMAAGKSTVAQALAERLPRAAHVRGDVFRRMVVSGRAEYEPGAGPESEAEAQLRLRHRLSAATADAYARAGFTAVVQDVLLGEHLTAYTALVRTRPLYVVVLAPDPRVVAQREAGRAKTGYGAWTVEQLDAGLRADTPRIGLWLDTSGQTPAQTVDAILAAPGQARVN